MGSKPSNLFSNGTEAMIFNDYFCCRCTKYKLDSEGMPLPDNCEIENALAVASFDETAWPAQDIVSVGEYRHICRRFESNDEELMQEYRKLFEAQTPIMSELIQQYPW